MTELDKIGKKFQALMWEEMEQRFNEKHHNAPRTSPHKTTQARVLEKLKDEILNYFNKG